MQPTDNQEKQMKLWNVLALAATVSLLAACHSVTIRPEGVSKRIDRPDFEESKDFWVFGLVNEYTVDVTPICGGRRIEQMQSQSTVVDSLIGIVTLGIYTPRSVRVWCQG